MDTLSTSEAKNEFNDLLLKAQRAPVQINENGKPLAVVMSIAEYESFEALRLRFLQSRYFKAKVDSKMGDTLDGEAFLDDLESGRYD